MSSHEFTIPVADLDASGRSYKFPLRPAWVRGALEGNEATAGTEEGLLEVRASKSGSDIIVHGRLKGAIEVPCARCLKPVGLTVDEPVSVLFVPASKLRAESPDMEISAAEADMVPFDGETVVLDEVVHDELILAAPMIPLCSEDCPGMGASPGVSTTSASAAGKGGAEGEPDKPLDPRLAPLLRLKKLYKE